MTTKEKILVTGAQGFIGKHLIQRLSEYDYEIFTSDISNEQDLCDPVLVSNLPDVDIVLHLAAYNGTKHFYNKPYTVVRNNILPTQFLLDRYAGKCRKFIFSGTCESYAGAIDLLNYKIPTDERVPLVVEDVTNPRWSYGGTKIANELQVISAYNELNQDYLIIRYHNVYGPGQRDHFIPEFVERALTGDVRLFGYENTRSFIYIDDAVDATIKLIRSEKANYIVNVGNDDETSIEEVAEIILSLLKISTPIKFDSAPIGSVNRRCPDISLLKNLIGYTPKITLKEGIEKTLRKQGWI